jgi:hypothetical protein
VNLDIVVKVVGSLKGKRKLRLAVSRFGCLSYTKVGRYIVIVHTRRVVRSREWWR